MDQLIEHSATSARLGVKLKNERTSQDLLGGDCEKFMKIGKQG